MSRSHLETLKIYLEDLNLSDDALVLIGGKLKELDPYIRHMLTKLKLTPLLSMTKLESRDLTYKLHTQQAHDMGVEDCINLFKSL